MRLFYRLIVSDFDGTLRRSEGGVSENNLQAVADYVKAGGIFVLCTGRMAASILPYARQLGLKGLIAACQGAQIIDTQSGEILFDRPIGCADAEEICAFLQAEHWHIHVYDGNDLYINKDDLFRAVYEKTCAVRGILTPERISDTVREKKISPQKIAVMCDASERDYILRQTEEKFGKKFYVTTSADNLVEIMRRGCDKGGALRFVAEHYGIPLSQTIAIGDNFNDLPMIDAAGLGVVVENGEEGVKKAAGFVTRSCDEDGVAYVIRKFGFGENI